MHWQAGEDPTITPPSGQTFTCTMWKGVPLLYQASGSRCAGGDPEAKDEETGVALMDVETGQATQDLFQDTQPDPSAGVSETPAAEAANDTEEPREGDL